MMSRRFDSIGDRGPGGPKTTGVPPIRFRYAIGGTVALEIIFLVVVFMHIERDLVQVLLKILN